MWRGPLFGGAYVVVVLNRFDEEKQILLDWANDANLPISQNNDENVFVLQDKPCHFIKDLVGIQNTPTYY